jgi:hypothetical protein
MRRILLLFLTSFLLVPAAFAQDSAADLAKWKPLQFLVGNWEAKTAGSEVKSIGTYSFQPELNGTILARHGTAESCKGPKDFDCDHHDRLYVYHDATVESGMRAIYFDNEGHVIRYIVTVPSAAKVVFQSEAGPGPQFRLTYELVNGTMLGKFQVAAAGQTEYHSYLEWSGGKK